MCVITNQCGDSSDNTYMHKVNGLNPDIKPDDSFSDVIRSITSRPDQPVIEDSETLNVTDEVIYDMDKVIQQLSEALSNTRGARSLANAVTNKLPVS